MAIARADMAELLLPGIRDRFGKGAEIVRDMPTGDWIVRVENGYTVRYPSLAELQAEMRYTGLAQLKAQSLLDLPYGLGTTRTAAMPPPEVMRAYLGLSNGGIAEAPVPEIVATPVDPHEPAIDLEDPTEIVVPKSRGRIIDL